MACVGNMMSKAKNDGKVFGIEHIPELVELSINNLKQDQPELLESGIISIQGIISFIFQFKNLILISIQREMVILD